MTNKELQLRLHKKSAETADLKKQIKNLSVSNHSIDEIKRLIHKIDNRLEQKLPNWITPQSRGGKSKNIPVLMLSDIHYDEIVFPEQINYVNKYNRKIANDRISYTIDTTIDLLKNKLNVEPYDGIVVSCNGDMLSGNIHEELSETNEAPILTSVLNISNILIQNFEKLADAFGFVFVPWTIGNHGRMHHKKRAKTAVENNYEYILAHFIKRHFANDSRVNIFISDSTDLTYKIYGKTFLQTHGDQFRGGNGISGIFSALMLGYHRKNKREGQVGKAFDVMLVGHFHQYVHTENIIVNGSIKGYDEYSASCNFSYEPPQQALFLVNSHRGITFRMPVRCDGYEVKNKPFSEKITVL